MPYPSLSIYCIDQIPDLINGKPKNRPKIDDKDHFELKGQFLKELRDNTFSGSDHEDANEHIGKVQEIVDLFHEVIWFYNGLDVPTRQILNSKGTSRTRGTKTSDGLAAIQEQLNSLGREIKKVNVKVFAAQVRREQCKGPHCIKYYLLKKEGNTLEEAYYTQFGVPFQQGGQYRAVALGFYQRNNENPWKMSKVLQERGFGSLPTSTKTNPRDHVKSISTIVEAYMTPIRRIGLSQYAVSAQQNSKMMFESRQMNIPFPCHLNDYYCNEKKGSYGLHCLDAYSYGATHVDDSLPRKEKDPERDEKITIESMKPVGSLINRVYMLSLRERMELDLEARLMGETLVLNRSLDPLYGDYIELNDLNVPLELRRDQVDDLMPTIKEGEWKIWMATEIKTWEISFLKNHYEKLHVWKQEGLMG
nr:hypothetical protein [Tanacetum cinerariifolium]